MSRRLSLPAEVCAFVENSPATVLLDSGKRYSKTNGRLFVAPARICVAWVPAEIPAVFREIENAVAAGWCAAGFFTYECGTAFEPKAGIHARRASSLESSQPLAWFGIYERSYLFDHATGDFIDGEPRALERYRAGGADAEDGTKKTEAGPKSEIAAEFTLSEAEYAQRIAAIHELIRAGDVYQLNFTAPFRFTAQGSMAALYARLRARQPVDYGAFLHWERGRFIQSFSPELFFRIEQNGTKGQQGRRIVTRPMKGTVQRGRTAREDRAIAEWLRNDPKNRSENVMIVDLLRNDLGRVAQTGTVCAERLFDVERHPTLWQMTSTVSADLRPEVGYHEIFRALFPSGSVTGAPKVRAMQLLAELEEAPRGVYTGAIGFFSAQETVFNVAIRTLELESGHSNDIRGVMGAGSGIVIDSDPAAEYRECLLKAEFLTRSAARQPEQFSLVETMLWDGGYPFLDLHLDRLTDSADYFGFDCSQTAVRTALVQHASEFADSSPRRVRLLLDQEGNIEISDQLLPQSSEPKPHARVRIATERTDPADTMLYHKTTHRPLYAPAFERASREGFDDVLFLNLHNEVTEGAISNVFIEKDGCWSTPPIECGLLAGVYRRHLLATRPEIEERVLSLEDLRNADAVYLTNAVRGLRRGVIAW
jgi:para-aminobenzoate synthetase / 4-amino-4-deoxychorismate lyase